MGYFDTAKEFGAYLWDSGASVIGVKSHLASDQFIADNVDPSTGLQMGIVNTPASNADFRLSVQQGEQKTLDEQAAQAKGWLGDLAGLLGIGTGILVAGAVVGGLIYISTIKKRGRSWLP